MNITAVLFINMQRRVKVINTKSNKICMQTHLKKLGYNDFSNFINYYIYIL